MTNKLKLFGLAAALGVAWAGVYYRVPIVIATVSVGVAIFTLVSGVQMILTRKADIPTSGGPSARVEYHRGLSAQFWGVLFLLFSVPIGAFGISYWLYGDNPSADIAAGIVRSPLISGLLMITTAAAIILYGLTRVLPGRSAFVETKIGAFERGVNAVYCSIVGLLLGAAGLIRMLAPGMLTRMRDGAIDWVLEMVK